MMNKRLIISGIIISLILAPSSGVLASSFIFFDGGRSVAHPDDSMNTQYEVYQVKSGDTLWRISQIKKVNVEEIKKTNGLKSDMIHVGQKLKLPVFADKDVLNKQRYVVKKGDNLWKIASKNNIDVTEIKKINSLRTNILQIGQILVLPNTESKVYAASNKSDIASSKTLASSKETLASRNKDDSLSTASIENTHESASEHEEKTVITYSKQEYEWLARIIEAEAEDEPYLGKVAVGSVIINRIQDDWFPDTIKGVIFQKSKKVYQFSPVGNGRFNRVKPSKDSYKAATEALNGVDPTDGALYFYNPKLTSDKWIRTRTVVKEIGQHKFAY
jgi:N-acetylmuramoyl-L-alanine amidase